VQERRFGQLVISNLFLHTFRSGLLFLTFSLLASLWCNNRCIARVHLPKSLRYIDYLMIKMFHLVVTRGGFVTRHWWALSSLLLRLKLPHRVSVFIGCNTWICSSSDLVREAQTGFSPSSGTCKQWESSKVVQKPNDRGCSLIPWVFKQ